MILIFNLELFLWMTKDILSTRLLVPEISYDLNHSLIPGLTFGPDHDLTNMLCNLSFADHSLSLIISFLIPPQNTI
jgi:hypothetical protein